MRIASFNVENLTDEPRSGAPLQARLDVLQPQLNRLAADILCLQEVDATKSSASARRELGVIDQLIAGTPYADFHIASSIAAATGAPRDKHNLVVLSRWPIVLSTQYFHDLVAAPSYKATTADPISKDASQIIWDRPVLHTQIELSGDRHLHLLNLHLKAPLAVPVDGQKMAPFAWKSVPGWAEGYFLASVKRSGQALEARMAIDRIFDADPKALIAVTGDFNAEEREVPLRILLGDTEDTGNGQLAGRALALPEHSVPETQRFSVIHRGRKQMLDHLLVSRPLLAHFRAFEVHNENLGDELVAYTLIESAPDSYHAPIVAEFDMT